MDRMGTNSRPRVLRHALAGNHFILIDRNPLLDAFLIQLGDWVSILDDSVGCVHVSGTIKQCEKARRTDDRRRHESVGSSAQSTLTRPLGR